MPDVQELYRWKVTTPAVALSTLPRKTEPTSTTTGLSER